MTRPHPTAAALALLALAPSLAALGCDLPRDADGTLSRVRGGTLRVGVVENPPWVTDSAGGVGGVEGAFVAELARGLGARPAWVRGPESRLLQSLQRRELDLVVGGLTDDVPWKQAVAFTKPYYTDTVVVGAPPSATRARELKGQTVAVEAGDPVAADVRKKGATPAPSADLTRASGLVAAPSWRLPALGRASTGVTLHEARHVLAAPQGENAWLLHVERLLRDYQTAIPAMLRSTRS
jgi:polar amino acid transport system substrate-binding protein